jgi:hypothetical protein
MLTGEPITKVGVEVKDGEFQYRFA